MKKLVIGLVSLVSLLVLAGCQKPAEPQEATEVLVNSLVYQEDTQQLAEMFVIEKVDTATETRADFLAKMNEVLNLSDGQKEELSEVYQKMEAEFHDKTSYKVKLVSNEKGRADLQIKVIGLTEQDEKKLEADLDKALDKVLEQVTDKTTEKEITEMVNEISFDALKNNLLSERSPKEPEVVSLSLMVDAKEKKKWVVQNEDTFMTELFTAFGE